MAEAEIGLFGGSGLYRFLEGAEAVAIDTPYGLPSARVTVGTVGGRRVAFLPRHGVDHELPPHAINYRANLWVMRELGVTWIIGPAAVGSLHPSIGIGDVVLCDQFVDRTRGRPDTFYDGPVTTHVSAAEPFSPVLRAALLDSCRALGLTAHDEGTVVVIQGPRFSTRAESRWFSAMGWHVVNMTAYPEGWLARELGIGYANVSLVTDYDVGLEGMAGVPTVTAEEVMAAVARNEERLRDLLLHAIPRLPREPDDHARGALRGASLSPPSRRVW